MRVFTSSNEHDCQDSIAPSPMAIHPSLAIVEGIPRTSNRNRPLFPGPCCLGFFSEIYVLCTMLTLHRHLRAHLPSPFNFPACSSTPSKTTRAVSKPHISPLPHVLSYKKATAEKEEENLPPTQPRRPTDPRGKNSPQPPVSASPAAPAAPSAPAPGPVGDPSRVGARGRHRACAALRTRGSCRRGTESLGGGAGGTR